MRCAVVGVFNSYGDASAAAGDLEIAGIVVEQVEVIKDADLTLARPRGFAVRAGTEQSSY